MNCIHFVQIHTSDNVFCSNSSHFLELSVKFASQIFHENINKPLDGAYLADFGIDISKLLRLINSLTRLILCKRVPASWQRFLSFALTDNYHQYPPTSFHVECCLAPKKGPDGGWAERDGRAGGRTGGRASGRGTGIKSTNSFNVFACREQT